MLHFPLLSLFPSFFLFLNASRVLKQFFLPHMTPDRWSQQGGSRQWGPSLQELLLTVQRKQPYNRPRQG